MAASSAAWGWQSSKCGPTIPIPMEVNRDEAATRLKRYVQNAKTITIIDDG
ncbi:MAG: hypothetical protein ACYTGS_02560 [Planctomycetota bacterium]